MIGNSSRKSFVCGSLAGIALAITLLLQGGLCAGERVALVIGVHQYDKNQLRNLPFAESDAVALAERLKTIGFDVILMTQTAGAKESHLLPTAAKLRETIDGFLAPSKWEKDDTAFIVLSGHGVQFKEQKSAYFCPMDANLAKRETLIDIHEIYQKLERCPAAFKLLVADCCRNDPLEGISRARSEVDLESITRPQQVPPPGGVAAFFSCSEGEKAFESAEFKRGIFTHFLLEAMSNSKADIDEDQNLDLDELVIYTKRNVKRHVNKELGATFIQVPQLVGETRGSLAIVDFTKLQSKAKPPSPEPVPKSTTPAPVPMPKPSKPDSNSAPVVRREGELGVGTKAGETWEDNTLKMKFRWCPDGAFTMGSPAEEVGRRRGPTTEEDQVNVQLTGYWIGQMEVTQAEWQSVMKTTLKDQAKKWRSGYTTLALAGEDRDFPMYYVSHGEATEFARLFTEQERTAGKLPAGWEFRLPTEAQWEYACRAGTTTATAFGDKLSSKQANFSGKRAGAPYNGAEPGPDLEQTEAVGSYKPNAWGVHDMHGNVAEWCRDLYRFKLPGRRDPEINLDNGGLERMHIYRGGSWSNEGSLCRSAYRTSAIVHNSENGIGFRLVAVPMNEKIALPSEK